MGVMIDNIKRRKKRNENNENVTKNTKVDTKLLERTAQDIVHYAHMDIAPFENHKWSFAFLSENGSSNF